MIGTRRSSKGGDKAGEKGDPGEMEGSHVRVGKGEEPEDLGLVLRVDRQGELGRGISRDGRGGD